jgi:hypothetical protein
MLASRSFQRRPNRQRRAGSPDVLVSIIVDEGLEASKRVKRATTQRLARNARNKLDD